MIPNVRKNENGYNTDDLRGERAAYLKGYDAAVMDILDIENNLDYYIDNSPLIRSLADGPEKLKELLTVLKDWSEQERNITAVALLDDQAERG